MSFLYTIIPKNYKNDIVKASNGFFLDMCDTIDFRSMYNKIKALPVTKMVDIADNFNANLKDASDYTNTDVIMNDIELADRDTIYAKLEVSTTIDIKNYVGRQLYRKFEEIDSDYKIKNRKKSYFKTKKEHSLSALIVFCKSIKILFYNVYIRIRYHPHTVIKINY